MKPSPAIAAAQDAVARGGRREGPRGKGKDARLFTNDGVHTQVIAAHVGRDFRAERLVIELGRLGVIRVFDEHAPGLERKHVEEVKTVGLRNARVDERRHLGHGIRRDVELETEELLIPTGHFECRSLGAPRVHDDRPRNCNPELSLIDPASVAFTFAPRNKVRLGCRCESSDTTASSRADVVTA
jgi:hypothetical protein